MFWIAQCLRVKPDLPLQTCSSYRSALMYIIHFYEMPVERLSQSQRALTGRYVGLKRKCNEQNARDRSAKLTIGKDPLPFCIYQILGKVMLTKVDREFIWGRTLMILGWNLMSRSSNTAALMYNHMDFSEDSLRFYIIHPKNDQSDDRAGDPKHVYCNPTKPEMCPFLAVGQYLCCLTE